MILGEIALKRRQQPSSAPIRGYHNFMRPAANKPLLTAVIPVGNLSGKLKNLRETLTRAISQPIEIIVVLDLKDDETKQELEEIVFSLDSPKIRILEGRFGSPGDTRNEGMKHVDTKWICFWDGDDIADVENFLSMVKRSEAQNANVAIGSYKVIDFQSGKTLKSNYLSGTMSKDLIPILANPGLWRFAFRFDKVKSCSFTSWKLAEDQDFLIQTKFWEEETSIFNTNVYRYSRFVEGQLTSANRKSADILKSVDLMFERSLSQAYNQQSKKVLSFLSLKQILTYIKSQSDCTKFQISFSELSRYFKHFKFVGFVSLLHLIRHMATNNQKTTSIFLQGGLGNNLFQIAAANSQNPQKIRFVFWRGDAERLIPICEQFSSQTSSEIYILNNSTVRRVLNRAMRNSITNYPQNKFKIHSILSLILRIYFTLAFKEKTIIRFGEDIGWTPVDNKNQNSFLVGYFQSYKYLTWPSQQVDILQILPTLSEETTKNAEQEAPLVVHVRLGDYRHEPDFGIPSASYYSNAIQELMGKCEFKKIWLFSDEPDAAIELIPAEYRQRVNVNEFRDLDAATTIATMNLGSAYVIGNSTFAWWGAFLGRNSGAPVIAPREWFASIEDPADLIPPNWIKRAPHY